MRVIEYSGQSIQISAGATTTSDVIVLPTFEQFTTGRLRNYLPADTITISATGWTDLFRDLDTSLGDLRLHLHGLWVYNPDTVSRTIGLRFADSGQNEIQRLAFGASQPTSGNYTLSDGVDTTSNIAYNASNSTIDTRLQTDISSITATTLTGGALPADYVDVEITNPAATAFDLLTFADVSLDQGEMTITRVAGGRPAETTQFFEVVLDADHYMWFDVSANTLRIFNATGQVEAASV